MSTNFQVYVDMDGVIADFYSTISNETVYPRLEGIRKSICRLVPELEGFEQYALKAWFKNNPELRKSDKKVKEAYRLYQIYSGMFYKHVGEQGFFEGLALMKGANELVDGIIDISDGQLPIVLTAPVDTAWCPTEKRAWIDRNFKGKFSNFICQRNKHEYAAPGSVLVDDLVKNTVPWMESGGGLAVLYVGNYNDAHQQILNFRKQIIK